MSCELICSIIRLPKLNSQFILSNFFLQKACVRVLIFHCRFLYHHNVNLATCASSNFELSAQACAVIQVNFYTSLHEIQNCMRAINCESTLCGLRRMQYVMQKLHLMRSLLLDECFNTIFRMMDSFFQCPLNCTYSTVSQNRHIHKLQHAHHFSNFEGESSS